MTTRISEGRTSASHEARKVGFLIGRAAPQVRCAGKSGGRMASAMEPMVRYKGQGQG